MADTNDLETRSLFGFGWIPDLPDYRDYTPETEQVNSLFLKGNLMKPQPAALPPALDLRSWFSPVDDQDGLGSCTAHAADALVEYCERRAFGSYTDISRRFVYKVTRKLMGLSGDTGASIRTTMGTLALFGAPPEKYWPYDAPHYEDEPTAFVYALAAAYKAITYYRLDIPGTSPAALLDRIRQEAARGFPPMFGFTVYSSYTQASTTGKIPFPASGEKIVGGHAICIAGYDNNMKIKNTAAGSAETTGALLFKNSWGLSWGDQGYGWLPYDYVLKGLTSDWWCLTKTNWIESGKFGI